MSKVAIGKHLGYPIMHDTVHEVRTLKIEDKKILKALEIQM